MKASDLLVSALESEGVSTVFGLPGEENLDVVESLRRSRIRLVVTRHEQAAGVMAATAGRLTGRAGVCLATLGPGATNLTTAAAYAGLGGMPLVMLTGQKAIRDGKQGRFQLVDVVDVMRPLTKHARSLVSGEAIPAAVRDAFRVAEEERPGAVLIELPEDVARDEVARAPIARSAPHVSEADGPSLALARRALAAARRPVMMVGAGAARGDVTAALASFARETGLPFFTTQLGKGVLDEESAAWMGTAALTAGERVHRFVEESDLVLAVGHEVVEKPPFRRQAGQRIVHLGRTPSPVDPVYAPDVEVTGELGSSLRRLARGLSPARWDRAFHEEATRGVGAELEAAARDARFPLHPARLVAEVRRAMPDDGVVCLDNGMYKLWFARGYRARRPSTLLLDNALATMGAGLPSAIAAKLVHPDRKVLAVCGDGGFLMSAQELATAQQLGLDLVVLVVRDDGYGMIRWKQGELGFSDHGMTLHNPDFVRYAEAFGARACG